MTSDEDAPSAAPAQSAGAPSSEAFSRELDRPPFDRTSFDRLGFERPTLEELLPRQALSELCASFAKVSRLEVYVETDTGAGVYGVRPAALPHDVVRDDDATVHIGDRLVGRVEFDRETLGFIAIGPIAPEARASGEDWFAHLRATLGQVAHARLRAHYAASMHLASVESSYQELCQKNAALEEALEHLHEVDELKSNFLATMSHELRTPLTSIHGYAEMLADQTAGPLNDEQREYVRIIRAKGTDLLNLILSLLDLAKLERGVLQMHPVAVPIGGLLREAKQTVAPLAAKRKVSIHVLDGECPAVRVDPDRLRQVFVNLLENGVKFTPSGGRMDVSFEVTDPPVSSDGFILMAPVHRELEIRFSDTGIGIAHHDRERVFDPFFQVDGSTTRETGGTGLGLAIAKRIVEAHGGRIRIEDNTPRGVTFVITLGIAS